MKLVDSTKTESIKYKGQSNSLLITKETRNLAKKRQLRFKFLIIPPFNEVVAY